MFNGLVEMDAAARRDLIAACRAESPSVRVEEIARVVIEMFVKTRGKARNLTGMLLTVVPRQFESRGLERSRAKWEAEDMAGKHAAAEAARIAAESTEFVEKEVQRMREILADPTSSEVNLPFGDMCRQGNGQRTFPGYGCPLTASGARPKPDVHGNDLYLVYRVWFAAGVVGGTMSVTVDGTVLATVSGSDPGFGGTQNGTTDTYLLARVPLGALGAHTVTVTHTGAIGTTVGLLWAGVPQADYRTVAGAPRVLVGLTTNSPSGNQTYAADVYNLQLKATAASLAADGLNITLVPTDRVLNPGSDFVDLLHPNNAGHAKLAATFEQYR